MSGKQKMVDGGKDWHAFCQASFNESRRTIVGGHVSAIQGAAPSGEKPDIWGKTRRPKYFGL